MVYRRTGQQHCDITTKPKPKPQGMAQVVK
jgi:hypothetical protein